MLSLIAIDRVALAYQLLALNTTCRRVAFAFRIFRSSDFERRGFFSIFTGILPPHLRTRLNCSATSGSFDTLFAAGV
jgi:hypothetical protein